MMDMMVTNVRGKPAHDRAGLHIAGRFQRCFFVSPTRLVAEGNPREIVLGVEKVRADRMRNQMRNSLGEDYRLPPAVESETNANGDVNEQGQEAIPMFAPVVQKWVETHPVEEHEEIAESDCKRMANE